MRSSLLPVLLLAVFTLSLVALVAPAFAQGPHQVKPDGAGFAVPPKDATTPAGAGDGGAMTKIIVVAGVVAAVALGVALALKGKTKGK